MTIIRDSDIRVRSVSFEAVQAKFAGTPFEPWGEAFWLFASQYGIDPNWGLAYLQWENGFGRANDFFERLNNAWDILCVPGGQWGQESCWTSALGYSYAVYPNKGIGIEAGFRLWKAYVDAGLVTWAQTLCRASIGTVPCDTDWVRGVISTGNQNSELWPVEGAPAPAPIPPGEVPGCVSALLTLPWFALRGLKVALSRGVKESSQYNPSPKKRRQ